MKIELQKELPLGKDMKLCTGPLHPNGKLLPIDSFSYRSRWCRACMSDYDKKRGSLRGTPRSVKKQAKKPPCQTKMNFPE